VREGAEPFPGSDNMCLAMMGTLPGATRRQLAGMGSDKTVDMEAAGHLAGSERADAYRHVVSNPVAGPMRSGRSTRLKMPLPGLVPGHELGATSGEFAFAVLVLALAIVLGGLGGVWIARREGLQKPKATEATQVKEQPSVQPAKQPESEEAAGPPAKTPPPKVSEVKSETGKAAAKAVGARFPSIEAITYSSTVGTTQVEIELGTASLVRAAGLSNPERVYFDLQTGGRTQGSGGRLDAPKAISVSDDTLLAGIRVARWNSGNIRVVLDLKRPCDFSYRLSPPPAPRLIVELKARRASGAAPKAPEKVKYN